MTPWDLQKSLIAEIEELLAQMQLKNAAGEDVVGVKGYEQRLPEITDDEEDQSRFFPYFIVRIEEGNTPTDDEPWLVGTTVLFGICDYDKETNGHRTILEMITKITNRFLERPLLDSKFRANQNVSFALQDEDTYHDGPPARGARRWAHRRTGRRRRRCRNRAGRPRACNGARWRRARRAAA